MGLLSNAHPARMPALSRRSFDFRPCLTANVSICDHERACVSAHARTNWNATWLHIPYLMGPRVCLSVQRASLVLPTKSSGRLVDLNGILPPTLEENHQPELEPRKPFRAWLSRENRQLKAKKRETVVGENGRASDRSRKGSAFGSISSCMSQSL